MNKLFKKLAGGFMALTMMFCAAASAPLALKQTVPALTASAAGTLPIEAVPSDIYFQYEAHVQDYGWMDAVDAGEIAGTTGQSRRLEALCINTTFLRYNGVFADNGAVCGWKTDGAYIGSVGQSRALQCIAIQIRPSNYVDRYDVYYRVHIAGKGWLGWSKNGGAAGNNYGARIEAVQIKVVRKNHYDNLAPATGGFVTRP